MGQYENFGGQPEAYNALLGTVERATTLEAGFAAYRAGLADIIADTIGTAMNSTLDQGDIQDGGGGGAVTLTQQQVQTLSSLHQSLTVDNERWADALIANTPLAENAGQGQDQAIGSRAAMA